MSILIIQSFFDFTMIAEDADTKRSNKNVSMQVFLQKSAILAGCIRNNNHRPTFPCEQPINAVELCAIPELVELSFAL